MALPATDTFTAADGTALTTYSASWTNNVGAWAINTNAAYSNTLNLETGVHWNADVFDNGQYAQAVAVAVAASNWRGPAVRCHASDATYYGYYGDTTTKFMFKSVAGTWTQIGSTGGATSVNDVLRLEVSGTTLTPKINGALDSAVGAIAPALAWTLGKVGIWRLVALAPRYHLRYHPALALLFHRH